MQCATALRKLKIIEAGEMAQGGRACMKDPVLFQYSCSVALNILVWHPLLDFVGSFSHMCTYCSHSNAKLHTGNFKNSWLSYKSVKQKEISWKQIWKISLATHNNRVILFLHSVGFHDMPPWYLEGPWKNLYLWKLWIQPRALSYFLSF